MMTWESLKRLKWGKKGEEDAPGFGSFPDEMLSDDDNDDDNKRSAILKQLNSHGAQNPLEGGFVEGEENHKTKKEIIEEVILKSKYFKAQKARDKEENEQLIEELNKKFTFLVQSQIFLSLTEPGKMNALKALLNKNVLNEHVRKEELPVSQRVKTYKQEQPDSYDKLYNEIVLDIRAQPSDLTKTAEEIAQEERERLEQLEISMEEQ